MQKVPVPPNGLLAPGAGMSQESCRPRPFDGHNQAFPAGVVAEDNSVCHLAPAPAAAPWRVVLPAPDSQLQSGLRCRARPDGVSRAAGQIPPPPQVLPTEPAAKLMRKSNRFVFRKPGS